MNLSSIYRKTDKGFEEIRDRSHGLPARYRALLIMVDGKTAMSKLLELLEKATATTDANQQFQILVEQGFIEEVPGTAPPSPAPAAAPAAGQDLANIKRLVNRKLYDVMGPEADLFTIKIEAAETLAEVKALAQKSRDAVQAARGSRLAESFWNDISAHLPA